VRELTENARAALKSAPLEYAVGEATAIELGQRFESALQVPCAHDARLDTLAQVVAETMVSTGQLPSRSLTQWLMWRIGALGELHDLQAWNASGDAELLLDRALTDQARTIQPDARGAPLRYGVARVLQAFGNEWGQVVVVSTLPLQLDTLPKLTKRGAKVELQGRFNVRVVSPTLHVDDSDVQVREIPLKLEPDGRFTVAFDAPATEGRRFIEVSALDSEETPENPQWMRSLLMVPLYVDVPEPVEPDALIRTPAPNPPSLADWPRRAVALYNQRRTAAGLPALELDPIAVSIAAGQAKALAQSEDAPPDPQLLLRLAQAGLPTRNAQQHGGRVEYLDESTVLSLYSPSLKMTLMNPSVTRVGIAFEPVTADRRLALHESTVGSYAGSAVFVAPVGELDPDAEVAALTMGLNRLRKEAGRSELQLDLRFSAIAMTHAQAACAGRPLSADALASEVNGLGFSGE
jgi:uncharacterized protein YkwD